MTDPLDQIKQAIEAIDYGSLTFTVYRHNSKTTTVTFNEHQNMVFKDNMAFKRWILTGFKQFEDANYSGPIELSITLKDGQFTKATEHRNKQI